MKWFRVKLTLCFDLVLTICWNSFQMKVAAEASGIVNLSTDNSVIVWIG